MAHVIFRDPFPELELLLVHDGFRIQDAFDLFCFVEFGLVVVYFVNKSRIEFFLSELHHHALARFYGIVLGSRNSIGIQVGNCKRQNNIGK